MIRSGKIILTLVVAFWVSPFVCQASNGLNDLLGIQLWGGGSLWNDVASDTAGRLKLSDQEHQSQNQSQNNGYFRANIQKSTGLKIMGARVYSVEIYSVNQKVTRVVFGFVNRTDLSREFEKEEQGKWTSNVQFMAAFNKKLDEERKAGVTGMSAQLESRLGVPTAGASAAIKQWSWNDNLITLEDAELALTLRIEPKIDTANVVASSPASNSTTVRSRSNGDVVITGIPPISQGPRGFCVPASWEKCLRYHGLNMDVYQLGETGGTEIAGTLFVPFANKVKPLLETRHYTMQLLNPGTLGLDMVKTYIDQSMPLIWSMDARSLPYWVLRSRKRTSYLNDQAEGLIRDPGLNPGRPAGHAILIVGYNAVVKEFALSDSTELGSGEGEIWIKEKDLQRAALPDGLVAVLPENSKLVGETKFTEASTLTKKASATPGGTSGKKWY